MVEPVRWSVRTSIILKVVFQNGYVFLLIIFSTEYVGNMCTSIYSKFELDWVFSKLTTHNNEQKINLWIYLKLKQMFPPFLHFLTHRSRAILIAPSVVSKQIFAKIRESAKNAILNFTFLKVLATILCKNIHCQWVNDGS